MKIFMATLATETNTFSPIPTGRDAFMGGRDWHRHDASRQPAITANIPLIAWRRLGEADGHQVVESLCTFAQPAGTTLRHIYEELRDTLLADLRAAMPVDVVLLFMHGAMVAHGYDDCEGDTLAGVARDRRTRGRDRHGTGPALPLDGADADQRGRPSSPTRNTRTSISATGRPSSTASAWTPPRWNTRPVMALHDCRMIGTFRPTQEPVRGFVARMKALEGRDGILSVSFGHGFPWADVADVGAKMLVIADGDMAKAEALAQRLCQELWEMREAATARLDSIDAGLDAAAAPGEGPIVLADASDNAGGGAPSDSTFVLRRILERGIRNAALGLFWDPQAVQFCVEAGEGATFLLRIGGKCGPASGDPVDLMVTVRCVLPEHSQAGLSGGRSALGPSVWVSAEGIDLVLVSRRQQTFAPDAFTGLGLTLHDKAAVVVKSSQHFQAAFAPIARAIHYLSGPGALSFDYAALPYTKRKTPFWPRVADPFGAA